MQLSTTLSEKHGLPLSLLYQESGFVFVLKKTEWVGELPKGFLHVSSQKGRWLFSSMELVCVHCVLSGHGLTDGPQKKMNARMRDALDETLILSNKWVFWVLTGFSFVLSLGGRIIQDLVAQILMYSGALYTASEAVYFSPGGYSLISSLSIDCTHRPAVVFRTHIY